MAGSLRIEDGGKGVARVVLDRPELHNAFDDALIASLTEALLRLEGDPAIRVVVLAGEGRSFSAGADLNWMKRMALYSEEENRRDAEALARLMRTLDRLAKPTIAAVHGPAIAGGCGLVACCDIAIASERASFSISEVRLGLIPAVIGPYVVGAIGQRAARRYVLTAEAFDAREALRIGLVHVVVPAEALAGEVQALCARIVANGPEAVAAAKELLRDVARAPLDHALVAETARRIAAIRVSPEGREGIASFLEKRRPGWTGP
ncbi:MAG: enoyl-CoA hydratase/isomerase family protein [Alphaproteobacteria bacterium]|nr:enoyl-CoA hydratase/isomerase family protein [Alphaproteobacteria bacterium]